MTAVHIEGLPCKCALVDLVAAPDDRAEHGNAGVSEQRFALNDRRAVVPHRDQDARRAYARTYPPHSGDLREQLTHTGHGKGVDLDRDNNIVRRRDCRDAGGGEGRRAVDEHHVVCGGLARSPGVLVDDVQEIAQSAGSYALADAGDVSGN